jgi:hypothetical protein
MAVTCRLILLVNRVLTAPFETLATGQVFCELSILPLL